MSKLTIEVENNTTLIFVDGEPIEPVSAARLDLDANKGNRLIVYLVGTRAQVNKSREQLRKLPYASSFVPVLAADEPALTPLPEWTSEDFGSGNLVVEHNIKTGVTKANIDGVLLPSWCLKVKFGRNEPHTFKSPEAAISAAQEHTDMSMIFDQKPAWKPRTE